MLAFYSSTYLVLCLFLVLGSLGLGDALGVAPLAGDARAGEDVRGVGESARAGLAELDRG